MLKRCLFGSRKKFREYAKKYFKKIKEKDREIGLELNHIIQEAHLEMGWFSAGVYIKKSPPKNPGELLEIKKYMDELGKKARKLREVPRLKKDFPTFSHFWKYLKKEKISMASLQEMEKEERTDGV